MEDGKDKPKETDITDIDKVTDEQISSAWGELEEEEKGEEVCQRPKKGAEEE